MLRAVVVSLAMMLPMAAAGVAGAPVARAEAAEDAGNPRMIDVQHVVTPVVREGRLVNYLFVSLRVEVAPSADVWAVRDRAQFLRDALVRAAHRGQLADPRHNDRLNEAAAVAVFTAAARETLGSSTIAGVHVVNVIAWRPVRRAPA